MEQKLENAYDFIALTSEEIQNGVLDHVSKTKELTNFHRLSWQLHKECVHSKKKEKKHGKKKTGKNKK